MAASIREYDAATDRGSLLDCVVTLQDFERELEPELPPGRDVADSYLTFLFEHCAKSSGRVFVAESDGRVIGFVGVLTRVPPEGPEDPPDESAYITDLVVLPRYRGEGIGRALLARAEQAARESGVGRLQLTALVRNLAALELYRSCGFRDFELRLWKTL
jgi:ribosomal protein S18 acetylase RimI-like enzyme